MVNNKKVLVLIDIQKEYITKGRPYYLNGIEDSLDKAKACLKYARRNNYKIIHVKHIQNGEIFSKDNHFSDFIDGFEPLNNECVITKSNFSSYSNKEFTNTVGNSDLYIVGHGSTMCCLSTTIDAYHRGNKVFFISDASYAKKTPIADEKAMHLYATEIIKSFATVITANSFYQLD